MALSLDFDSRTLRARHRHYMGAGFGEMPRQRRTDAARGAGDQRDLVSKGLRIIGHLLVMAELVPAIHVLLTVQRLKDVDGRDKAGHDGIQASAKSPLPATTTALGLLHARPGRSAPSGNRR